MNSDYKEKVFALYGNLIGIGDNRYAPCCYLANSILSKKAVLCHSTKLNDSILTVFKYTRKNRNSFEGTYSISTLLDTNCDIRAVITVSSVLFITQKMSWASLYAELGTVSHIEDYIHIVESARDSAKSNLNRKNRI